jgi:hypothetical protein
MQDIVRKAQCDFQFASIFVQFKTNQILIAGFNNLGHALDEMSWRITTSIDNLASAFYEMSTNQNETMSAIHSQIGSIAEATNQHFKVMEKASSKIVARTNTALGMLDNIQRGKRPIL